MVVYLGSDGFENGTKRMDGVDNGGQATISTTVEGVKTGTYCILLGDNGWIRYAITGTPANPSVSFWLQFNADVWAYNNVMRVQFILTTSEIIELKFDGVNKTWDAYVDGVKVADGTVLVPSRNIFHTQFSVLIDNAGTIDVKLMGQDSINYSGDTLPVGASAQVAYLKIFNDVNDIGVWVDDIVWGTAGPLGDCRCDWLVPNADTVVDDWTPTGGGDDYADVDNVPASTAQYLWSEVNGEEVELGLANWDGVDKTPVLVTSWAYMKEDDATAESIEVGVDSNGVDDTTTHIATDMWLYESHVMQQDPDGPAAWVDAAIDALLWRAKAVI